MRKQLLTAVVVSSAALFAWSLNATAATGPESHNIAPAVATSPQIVSVAPSPTMTIASPVVAAPVVIAPTTTTAVAVVAQYGPMPQNASVTTTVTGYRRHLRRGRPSGPAGAR